MSKENRVIRTFILFLGIYIFASIFNADANKIGHAPIFIVGQDVQSINDFVSSLRKISGTKPIHYPDGFMTYVAINDLRGLSEPVDHGAGVNFADELIKNYPECNVIQIGLYMKYMLKEVASGGLDKNIIQIGQWIKHSNKDVYLRIGYEFDNPENEYNPRDYIQAYRYVVDKLRKMDIPNVHFVWHTAAWKGKDWPVYDPIKWYPGDQYVDWIGVSFFDSQRDEELNVAAELAKKINKPLMIAESSPFNKYTDKDKLQWIKRLFDYIKKYDIRFLSYINVNWDTLPLFETNNWGDARLERRSVLIKEWLKQVSQFHKNI